MGGGPFHDEPRAAGVFVPGLARADLADPAVSNLLRAPTLTLGQTDSQECLPGSPTPRRIAFQHTDSDASVGSGDPNKLASPVQPPLHAQQSQASLASTMQYRPASPAPTTIDAISGTPVTVSSDVLLPDNQLGDSQLYPPTPASTSKPAVAPPPSTEQAANTPAPAPPPPPPTPDTPQTALALQETQQSELSQRSTEPSPTPPPQQCTQSSGSAPTASGDTPTCEPEGTMYTDGTYWKTLNCIGVMLWDSLLNWCSPYDAYSERFHIRGTICSQFTRPNLPCLKE